jgi:hypothetical protein
VHCFDQLQLSASLQNPSEAGYSESEPLNGIKTTKRQETYVKLFWACYLGVSNTQIAVATGQDLHSAPDHEACTAISERLKQNFVRSMRNKTSYGKSYLAQLVQHVVQLHDFEVVVFNLARKERQLGIAPAFETEQARLTREREQNMYVRTSTSL